MQIAYRSNHLHIILFKFKLNFVDLSILLSSWMARARAQAANAKTEAPTMKKRK